MNNLQFISNCDKAINGNNTPVQATTVIFSQEALVHTSVAASSLGTTGLKFWNYFSLPVGGILGLLMSIIGMMLIRETVFGIIMIPMAIVLFVISVLRFVTAVGVRRRRLCSWQWNLMLSIMIYLYGTIPTPFVHKCDADIIVEFVFIAVLWG